MKRNYTKSMLVAALAALLAVPLSAPVMASGDEAPVRAETQQEYAYGWQLMTDQERAEHRMKMRSFRTNEEREAYRLEHHQLMQERAREQGVTLPDEPLPRGQGFGMGAGRGPGGGAGPGR
jgi:hypothetical protein